MSYQMKVSLLALVGAAAAVPHYALHSRHHHGSGYAGPSTGWSGHYNDTRPLPTGTGVASASGDDKTTTILQTQYATETLVSTVYATRSKPGAGGEAPSSVAAAEASTGGEACGPATVYVTATNKVTVTVPAGGAPSSVYTPPASPPDASSAAPEVPSSSVYTPPVSPPDASSAAPEVPSSSMTPGTGYGVPTPSESFALESSSAVHEEQPSSKGPESTASPVSYTTPAATEVPTSYAAPSSVAPSSAAPESSAPASSATPSSTPSSPPSYSGGKRGLAYRWDGAADCKTFAGKNFGFAWNWEADSRGDIGDIPFIPTLRTLANAGDWSDKVNAAIEGGSKVVFGFNEPDISTQAALSVDAACSAWKEHMNPIASAHPDVTIVGPSISSSQNEGQGLSWLHQFKTQCSDAVWSAANIHWYGPASAGFEAFKAHVEKAISEIGMPVWVTEFGLTGATAEESAAFLKEAQAYLDSNDKCQGYSYYAVGNFEPAANLLGNADSLTATGEVYVS